ncbi:probable aminotransferase TAT2 [Herrania umbratica]|uniref:Probable aminotransferase TAT2 n=1 Tax=Herrania umbratica TaxID=108875 RepID=A0A6J1BKW6_9ROSI|nr:probable aminotransferase TAT2 [Herrania umbratica]
METILIVLASAGANILLLKLGFPNYEARCAFSNIEGRHYDILDEKGWEVGLDVVKALIDENTVAKKARKIGILVITNEVYEHLTFGSNPFVPMGVIGSMVPVVTLNFISKKWVVLGWRLGIRYSATSSHSLPGSMENAAVVGEGMGSRMSCPC